MYTGEEGEVISKAEFDKLKAAKTKTVVEGGGKKYVDAEGNPVTDENEIAWSNFYKETDKSKFMDENGVLNEEAYKAAINASLEKNNLKGGNRGSDEWIQSQMESESITGSETTSESTESTEEIEPTT